MAAVRWTVFLLGTCCALMACGGSLAAEPSATPSTLREVKDHQGRIAAIEATLLPAVELAQLSQQANANQAFARLLRVSVDDPTASPTAMAGTYVVSSDSLRFTPQYPFRAGQAYRAVLHASELSNSSGAFSGDVTYLFQVPAAGGSVPAEVTAIFPSAAIVPENQLRFYLHFSAPMSRGNDYDHVQLRDSKNRLVDLPFLELGEELWDRQQQRLTLLIDPGRIKRGVTPREDLGTVLRAGEEFTLIIKPTWLDAQSRPLGKEFVKRFRVGPPIERAIDTSQWQITAPTSGSRQPLVIDFPQPLDRALLERMIAVRDAQGAPIEGAKLISHEERRWEFQPAETWPAGTYEIMIDSALEDLAGNRIGRPFEVDQFGPITQQIQNDFVRLKFEIPAQQ